MSESGIYYEKTYHRCQHTGSSVRTTYIYQLRPRRLVAEHVTISDVERESVLGVVDAYGAVIQPRGK